MTWNTVNVLDISCTGHTAMKLAGEILNVLAIYRVDMGWVLYPFPCNVLVMSQPGTPPFAPSVKGLLEPFCSLNWLPFAVITAFIHATIARTQQHHDQCRKCDDLSGLLRVDMYDLWREGKVLTVVKKKKEQSMLH